MNIFLQKLGACYHPDETEFILWSPISDRVDLLIESKSLPMKKEEQGYWTAKYKASPGQTYSYRLNNDKDYPDPASLRQPQGVHGPSAVTDNKNFPWTDEKWRGLPLSNMIIYELHTGCFSPTHDFHGIIEKLDYLQRLGINTIELMPLAAFPGKRNWGYDGVYPFAIQDSYGGIAGFQRLVDAAHAKGIAVIVDVVYNHMGPEGNYLSAYGPYFTEKYRTPWGSPLNFDDEWCDGVRNFFLQNARMWLEDYHVDGLRLDAVHAIRDFSAYHIIQQLKDLALDIQHRTDRKKIIIAEIDLNDPRFINPREKGGYGLDGQWADEFHHALHSLVTGERQAYYEDFGEIQHLENAFRHAYVYNGVYSRHRKRIFGAVADPNPLSQFVVFLQNHDQIGNRPLGDRLSTTLTHEQLKLSAATVLLSPYVPLLFMGEEYGEQNPFLFFVDFQDTQLVEAVRNGRKREFGDFFEEGHDFPDPQSPETFERSCLSWNVERGAPLADYYRALIALRAKRPAMQGMTRESLTVHRVDGHILHIERKAGNDHLHIWLHFGKTPLMLADAQSPACNKIFDSASAKWNGPGEEEAPAGSLLLSPFSVQVFAQ